MQLGKISPSPLTFLHHFPYPLIPLLPASLNQPASICNKASAINEISQNYLNALKLGNFFLIHI
jgi:hypothetical protein